MFAKNALIAVLAGAITLGVCADHGGDHPSLILGKSEVPGLAEAKTRLPLLSISYVQAKETLDALIESGVDVPQPRDGGGGYTHEQHKSNGQSLHLAGVLYQLTGDETYADFARDLLLEYAELYPELGMHPARKNSQSYGKLFWQILNEAVWLVYAIQGYDAIVDTLNDRERDKIEGNFLRPMANFLSVESPQTFDKIHNHGTWATAAVGMTGYVLGDQDLVEKALLGLEKKGDAGFLKQIDSLFSPDGYYNEGPYYQRYALMPFLVFARAIDRNEPERAIFEYRDGLLVKAIYVTIQQSYNNRFFPINDAIKDKGLDTVELVYGVDIAYGLTDDPSLLSIAQQQGEVILSGDGLAVAEGIAAGRAEPFEFKSLAFRDGANGDQGQLAILRSGIRNDDATVVMKNTAQGMGHGHFDKLHWLFYDNGQEIIRDYGAARFLNVESKGGGGYLPENTSWAKTTVAHNTLVVDEKSHFDGKLSVAEEHHPENLFFASIDSIHVASASMNTAYPDVNLRRVLALIDVPELTFPVVLDVFNIASESNHQYDLPLYFNGQLTDVNFDYTAHTESMQPVGKNNGYQHLWHLGSGSPDGDLARITWLTGDRFYTLSTLNDGNLDVVFTQIGANDPQFNLRREQGLMFRVGKAKDYSFVMLLEPHGEYNGAKEYTRGAESQVAAIVRQSRDGLDFIRIQLKAGKTLGLALSYNPDESRKHTMTIDGDRYEWSGFYKLFKI